MNEEKGIGPFPHGSTVHKAVFMTLESYTGETTLEQGVLELVEELKTLRKGAAFVQKILDAAGDQPSVATGYLRDILEVLRGES